MIYEYIAEEIKARVKIGDVLFMYGYSANPNSKKRIPCPLHNGKDNNFSFTDKIYHCWVCGEHGDVISLVRKLFNLSFAEACVKINLDFGLGLPCGEKMSLRDKYRLDKKAKERKAIALAEKAETERIDNEFWDALHELSRLDRQLREHKPKTPDEPLHPLFVEALQKIGYAEYRLDIAEMRKNKNDGR